jgi:pimeloyl-ACP methyl ester carboxylesterase
MQKLNRDDVALYFKDEGSGTAPPMLFVHGWGCDHTFFAPQQAHFSHFQRTIAVDLRGHDASSAPIQDYTVEGFVDDLAHLCRELTLPKSIVVGHSMGGTIALQFVARHPEHVCGNCDDRQRAVPISRLYRQSASDLRCAVQTGLLGCARVVAATVVPSH